MSDPRGPRTSIVVKLDLVSFGHAWTHLSATETFFRQN
jgi:hypothetical protein